MVLGFIHLVEEVDGHDCSLNARRVKDDVLVEKYGVRKARGFQRLILSLRRSFLVSTKHPYTKYVFKSTRAISHEILRHAEIDITTIHPFSEFRSNWEIFMVVVHGIGILVYPFVLSFISHEGVGLEGCGFWNKVILTIFLLTMCDVVVNFKSGYVANKSKEIVLKKSRIAKRYILSYFFIDILSSFPYDLALINDLILPMEYHALMYLHLLKLIRIGTLYFYSKQMLERFKASYVVETVVLTSWMMVFFLHWVACLYTVRHVEQNPTPPLAPLTEGRRKFNQGSLFTGQNYDSLSLGQRWSHNVAIAVSNVIGCNMGFMGRTNQELATYVAVTALSLFFLIYIAVQVIIVTRIMTDSTARYERMLCQLKEYIRFKRIPPVLERRLIEYSRFSHLKTYLKESLIFRFLSSRLRQEVLLHSCNELIDQMAFFNHMPPGVIAKVVACLTPEVVLANDVVIKSGMHGDSMYFISSGTVAIYSSTGKEVCHLTDGAHFGEIALVVENVRVASVVAVETTELYALTRADFQRALAPHPLLLQRVRETARKRMNIIRDLELREKSIESMRRTATQYIQAAGKKSNVFPLQGLKLSQVTGKRPQLLTPKNQRTKSTTSTQKDKGSMRTDLNREGPLTSLRERRMPQVVPPPRTSSDSSVDQEAQHRFEHTMPSSLQLASPIGSTDTLNLPSTSGEVPHSQKSYLEQQIAESRQESNIHEPDRLEGQFSFTSSEGTDNISLHSVPSIF